MKFDDIDETERGQGSTAAVLDCEIATRDDVGAAFNRMCTAGGRARELHIDLGFPTTAVLMNEIGRMFGMYATWSRTVFVRGPGPIKAVVVYCDKTDFPTVTVCGYCAAEPVAAAAAAAAVVEETEDEVRRRRIEQDDETETQEFADEQRQVAAQKKKKKKTPARKRKLTPRKTPTSPVARKLRKH